MRALLTATLLGLALTTGLPAPGAAQDRPGISTVMLPHNVPLSQALASEAHRHDRAIAHIHQNQRATELSHKRTLDHIQKDTRLDGAAKARRIADENQRFGIQMRGLERQLAIAEQQHAQNEARIRTEHPRPSRMDVADRFDAEGSMLARAHAVAAEDIRYERALAHIDENRRAREDSHRRRLKDISDDTRLPADAKAIEHAEEDENFEVDLRNLERQRRIVEEEHQNRRAAIDARYGNPNTGEVFASGQTPPAQPGPAQQGQSRADAAPIGGGIGGSRQGGTAVTGPAGRPPLQGGADQTGTGAAGQQPPGSRPPVLQGRVEENVGFPPQPGEAPPQPCSKEWESGTPDPEVQFVEGLSASFARCFEADWAMMPVAPVAVLASKARWVRIVVNGVVQFYSAKQLLEDLRKQRPANECAYDTGLWYAQIACDARGVAGRIPEHPQPSGRLDPIRPVGPRRTGDASAASTIPPRAAAAPPGMPAPAPIQCVPLVDCFWRAMHNATKDPVFEGKFLTQPPKDWQEIHDTFKRYFAGKVPGVSSQNHANGIPERMTYDQIVQDLQSKEGAEAVAIAVYANNESHAFNAANFKGYVILIDDQKQFWSGNAPRQTVQQVLKGQVAYWLYYRTK